jgi:hypothetical protein
MMSIIKFEEQPDRPKIVALLAEPGQGSQIRLGFYITLCPLAYYNSAASNFPNSQSNQVKVNKGSKASDSRAGLRFYPKPLK